MTATTRLLVCAVAALLLPSGCGKKPPPPESATPAPPILNAGPPPTDEEVTAFASRLEKAVGNGDTAAVQDCLRVDNLIDRCISDLNLGSNVQAGIRSGTSGVGRQLVEQIDATVKNGGSYTRLRSRTLDGKPAVLFRLLHPDGALNYHEITVARHSDGKVAAEDLFVFVSGEPLSLTFRRLILQLLAGRDQRLGGKDRELFENMTQIQTFQNQAKAGDHAAALATFRRLPQRIQCEKPFQLMAVMTASEVSEQDYLTEMTRFRTAHPNDPCLSIVSIDFHLLRKEYRQSLANIDELDKAVGGDPFLHVMRATVRLQEGNPKEALEAAKAVIAAEPTLRQGHITAAQAAVALNDHAAAAAHLRQAVEKADSTLDFTVLRSDAEWSEFCDSAEFAELEKWYAARKK